MSVDITAIRERHAGWKGETEPGKLVLEMCAEIERLRRQLAETKAAYEQYTKGGAIYYHEVYCSGDRRKPMGCAGCSCEIGRELTRLRAIVDRAKDDGLADRIGRDCRDKEHDSRWCPTCESRIDGIEDYRLVVLHEAAAEAAGSEK